MLDTEQTQNYVARNFVLSEKQVFPIFLGKGIVLGALIYVSYRAKTILTEMNAGTAVDPTLLPLLMLIILAFIIFQIRKARTEPKESAAKA